MHFNTDNLPTNILEDLESLISKLPVTHLTTNAEDVKAFHTKFGVPEAEVPSFLTPEKFEFRLKFLHEELKEFYDDHQGGDLKGAADALIDLVYVAIGTAHMMGLPWEKLWTEVQERNMAKERATSATQSKRGSVLDVIKPDGWYGPDHSKFIGDGPWPTF